MTVDTTGNRAEYSVLSTTASFSFESGGVKFKCFDQDDLKIYVNGVLKTRTDPAQYTVSINTSNEATVTFLSSPTDYRPVAGNTVIIVREVSLAQTTNYQNNNIFDAETLEKSIDLETMKSQQVSTKSDRSIKFADDVTGVTSTVTEISTGGTARSNKILGFDSSGNISATVELGTNRGNWATSTAYVLRDIVKQNVSSQTSTYSNIYICTTAHTSTGTYLTQNDSSKWQLVFDIATTTTNATTATTGATNANTYRNDALDSKDTAVDYATRTGAVVRVFDGATNNTSDTSPADQSNTYSAKEHAIGDLTASGGSAKAWAIDASSPDGTSEKSAKTLAGEASTSASTATTQAGLASDHRSDASKYAVTNHDTTFSLSSTNGGTSGLYSAKHYATESANSASASQANSIVFAIALG